MGGVVQNEKHPDNYYLITFLLFFVASFTAHHHPCFQQQQAANSIHTKLVTSEHSVALGS